MVGALSSHASQLSTHMYFFLKQSLPCDCLRKWKGYVFWDERQTWNQPKGESEDRKVLSAHWKVSIHNYEWLICLLEMLKPCQNTLALAKTRARTQCPLWEMTTLPPPQGEHRLGCLHCSLASLFKAKGWSIRSIHSLVTVYSSATCDWFRSWGCPQVGRPDRQPTVQTEPECRRSGARTNHGLEGSLIYLSPIKCNYIHKKEFIIHLPVSCTVLFLAVCKDFSLINACDR